MRRWWTLLLLVLLGTGVLAFGESGDWADQLLEQVEQQQASQGLPTALVLGLIVVATLISEDLTCIAAGLLAAKNVIPPAEAVIACFAGIFLGDMLLYLAGRYLGKPALRRRPMRWIVSRSAEERAERLFRTRGAMIILGSRFLPGTRAATYFTAGVMHQPFLRFLVYFGVAAAIWTPLLVLATMHLGSRVEAFYEAYSRWALPGFIGAGLLIYLLFDIGIPMCSWRGRRLLLSRWRRLTRWEFWPLWFFNAPLLAYVFYLCFLKTRRPTLFTATNPGIPPDSGFIGESKSGILARAAGMGEGIAAWRLLPQTEDLETRLRRLEAFQGEHGLGYPIVLKPDEGQRGLGVCIAKSADMARSYLERTPANVIVQEYIPGCEFGVFYYRFPDAETGVIYSITDKRMTSVTGDGVHTLEELILRDDRAVCLAPTFFERFAETLYEVPEKGVELRLVEVGTHARGALFLDGGANATEALRERLDVLTQAFEGFYFGRFDIRVPSEEDLAAGKHLKIIEINGVTSEATHIYDPSYGALNAWKTLMRQWRIAFQIGAQNAARGVKPMPKLAFLKHWKNSFYRQRRIYASEQN